MLSRYDISFDSLNLDGWSLNRYHKFVEEETREIVPIDHDFIGIYINTGKAHHYKIDGFRKGIIHKNRYNLLFIPAGSCELSLPAGNYSAFCIEFTHKLFERAISGFITTAELKHAFLERLHAKVPASLSDFNATATSETLDLIREVTRNSQQYTGLLHQMVLNSQMVELLTRSITLIQDQWKAKLSNVERIKIKKVHDRLKNTTGQVSVSSLTEMTGMDKRTLEERFEIIYGNSISNVQRANRVKKAVTLLRDTTLPINDIRLALAYKNVRLFKKDFFGYCGCSPRRVREMKINF